MFMSTVKAFYLSGWGKGGGGFRFYIVCYLTHFNIQILFTLWVGVRVGNSLFGFLWAKEWFTLEKEWIAHVCSFVKSNKRELIQLLFKKERQSEEQWELFPLGQKGKAMKKIQKLWFFLANCSFFESDLLESRANHTHCYFLKSV